MTDKPDEGPDDRLALFDDVLKKQNLDWQTVTQLAKKRERDRQKKRKKLLAMLETILLLLSEVKDDLTVEELSEVQKAVNALNQAVNSGTNAVKDNIPEEGNKSRSAESSPSSWPTT
jgi:hypothetical protein